MYEQSSSTSLVLRSCSNDFTSYNDFQWPKEIGAIVTAPDFIQNTECGNGLHGWLYGEGDINVSKYNDTESVWMVLEVPTDTLINLHGKVKFPEGKIVFIGDNITAPKWLYDHTPDKNKNIINLHAEVGYKGILFGGASSVLKGGDGSAITGGHHSTVTGGNRSTITGGDFSTITGGDFSTITGGDFSTITGGDDSTVIFKYWDTEDLMVKIKVGYVCKGKLKEGVAYKLDRNNEIVKAY